MRKESENDKNWQVSTWRFPISAFYFLQKHKPLLNE